LIERKRVEKREGEIEGAIGREKGKDRRRDGGK
jgi:hypothetical protein